MKKVIIREEQERLLRESGYGNDDLPNLFNDLKVSLDDALTIVREHFIMCNRMHQQPNEQVSEIDKHLNAIIGIIDTIG
jgi:hypothetical protein